MYSKLQEKLYLVGVALTYYRILMSFKALRADLSKGNMAGYIIMPKNT